MKQFTLIALLGLGLMACSEDEDNNNQPTPHPNLSMKVDGTLWNPSNVGLLAAGDTSLGLTISALQEGLGSASTLTIDVEKMTPGTYAFDEDFNTFLYTNNLGIAYQSFVGSGNYTVTTLNTNSKNIQGTFALTARVPGMQDQVQVTEGKFNMTYVD